MNWMDVLALAGIVGTVADTCNKKRRYTLWLITSVAWCVVDTVYGLYAQAILFAVCAGVNVLALMLSHKNAKAEDD